MMIIILLMAEGHMAVCTINISITAQHRATSQNFVLPLYFCAGMVPCPVTPVVVTVVPVHGSSYPPLIVVPTKDYKIDQLNTSIISLLVSRDAPVSLAHSIRDEFSHEPVLLTPVSLVHVDQPPAVGTADGSSVGLRQGKTFQSLVTWDWD